jgi:hypothetical protein
MKWHRDHCDLLANGSNHSRRELCCSVIAILMFLLQPARSGLSQSAPDALRGVTHSASLTFVQRDGTRVDGPISKMDVKSITIQPYQKPPITIQRVDLLQLKQGDALLFSAISSWSDVEAAHVVPHEAFVLKRRNGKVIKGTAVKVTLDSVTLKHGLITTGTGRLRYTVDTIYGRKYIGHRMDGTDWR